MRRYAALALLAAVAGACNTGPDLDAPPLTSLEPVLSPAAPGSGEPNLVAADNGAAYLSWLEPSATGYALRFAMWEGGGWGAARTIMDRSDLFVNWADFPSMAVFGDGVLAAHWLEMSGPGTYAYDVHMALSRDGGKTWGEDVIPHRDGVEAEHGFVSLVPLPDRLAALWLDGRATPDGDPMTLRFTTIDPSGALGPEVPVDPSVCDCCQTAMAATSDGLVAVYRNRTPDEVRDIYITRYTDGAWSEGRPIHEDGWVIAGCPVNGPAIATRGDTVVATWFTAAETEGDGAASRAEVRAAGERGRVLAAFSTDAGATFSDPVRVDDGNAMGRVDVLEPAAGATLVSWLERGPNGAEVRVRRVAPGGVGPAVAVGTAAAQRATGFPRMVRLGDRVVFAWTVPGADGGVRTAVARPGNGETP